MQEGRKRNGTDIIIYIYWCKNTLNRSITIAISQNWTMHSEFGNLTTQTAYTVDFAMHALYTTWQIIRAK